MTIINEEKNIIRKQHQNDEQSKKFKAINCKMKSSCLKCGKYTKSVDPNISETNNGKTIILSKYPVCDAKKSRFIKKQEAERLLSNLDLKTPLKADSWLG